MSLFFIVTGSEGEWGLCKTSGRSVIKKGIDTRKLVKIFPPLNFFLSLLPSLLLYSQLTRSGVKGKGHFSFLSI